MRLRPILFLVFVVTPLVEIVLFVMVGTQIGLGATLAIVLITAFAGAMLVTRQGRATWVRLTSEFSSGQFPAAQLAHGAMILVAGTLLVTPGFLTDAIGLTLLIPAVRERLRVWAVARYSPGRTITL
jgi:UPF0716 protein FxsA